MTGFYAYCEKHGQVSEIFSDPKDAAAEVYKHKNNTSGPHGKVEVIERYEKENYGNKEIRYRKYRK